MSVPPYRPQEQAYQAGVAVLAPYLDGSTLDALSRVNKAFFGVFGGYLWADPIRSISDSRTPYTKTIKFITGPHKEHFSGLVQVLDFRPLLALRSDGIFLSDFNPNERYFNCRLIFNHLRCFKNLKFVVVDGVQTWNNSYSDDNECPRFDTKVLLLRAPSSLLLDSSTVLQADSFTDLMYLDISGTYHAAEAIASLDRYEFGNLRVLKMRNMRLTKLPWFILRLGLRLWSLDVGSNLLTDHDLKAIISYCMGPAITPPGPLPLPVSDAAFFDHPPAYAVHDDGDETMPARRPDSTTLFIEAMLDSRDAVANPMYLPTGLTQLYISNNKITAQAAKLLLGSTNRLQVLDLGAIRTTLDATVYGTQHATVYHAQGPQLMSPSQLEIFRVHHSLVTYIPTITLGSQRQYHTSLVETAENFGASYALGRIVSYDPLQNYRITHLILTDIPTRSYGLLIETLAGLLRRAYSQSSGIEAVRSTRPAARLRRAPQLLSGLRLIRMEFVHDDGGRGVPPGSVSGDRDADAFAARSTGDFSFFGAAEAEEAPADEAGDGGREMVLRDVVAELRAFRAREVPRWPGVLQLVVPARAGGV